MQISLGRKTDNQVTTRLRVAAQGGENFVGGGKPIRGHVIGNAMLPKPADRRDDEVFSEHSVAKIALETMNLSRVVGDKALISDISVRIYEGKVMAVVGRSGAGKSSFLRLLNRLDEPTEGTVLLYGRDYREISPRELRRRVGMLMQSAYLFPGTVAENLRFGPRQQGRELSATEIEALLEQVGLQGFAARDVMYLSGGEAQRVSLARTLANRPEVLLLDEPTSALDHRAAREIEALLADILKSQHLTTLMITHDSAQAARVADGAILIDAGRLVCDGPVAEVLDAESILP